MAVEKFIKIAAVSCTIAELITFVVGFASPYWIQSDAQRETGFERMGLWEACFRNYVFPSDPLGQRHNGCFWIFHITYRNVWRYLNPEWLLAIQVMMSIALVLQLVTIMFVIFYFLKCCPSATARYYVRAAYIMNFTAFLLIAICMIMFGAKADTDRSWLPNPDTNFMSWSFGFSVLSGFFTLFASLALLIEDVRLGQRDYYDRRPAYQMKAVPRR